MLWIYLITHSFHSIDDFLYSVKMSPTADIYITLKTVYFKYEDEATMFLILFFIYSTLYLFYIVLFGVVSYIFNWSVHVVCCAVTICFKFSCLMTAIGSVKCVCACTCVHAGMHVCMHACFYTVLV